MTQIPRRVFLQGAAATVGGAVIGGALQTLMAEAAGGHPPVRLPLGPVKDRRDHIVRLHLPPGFNYRSFHDTDIDPATTPPLTLSDGTTLPGKHDGMGAFPGRRGTHGKGTVWLIRNHEINGPGVAFGPNPAGPDDAPYDPSTQGGTTSTLVTTHGEVIESFTSLNGTQMNCSGGRMPWGSWITCEETVNGPDVGPDFTGASNATLTQRHGFLFEVPVGGKSNREPITSAGRFAHEAAAYSPMEGIVYLTEDPFGFPAGLYRYRPPRNPMRVGGLENGGVLQMLRVVGTPNAHLEATQVNGASYPVDWVDIADPDPTFLPDPVTSELTPNNTAIAHVGDQGRAQGAAHFSRLEGAAYTDGKIYFTSTQGGGPAETAPDTDLGYGKGAGQIWSYDPRRKCLTCEYQSPGTSDLELPDNITSRNDHGTVVICEDGPIDNYIRGLSPRGTLFDIALNRLTGNLPPNAPRFAEEFAGATFSPDGGTLFVNIQATKGVTFAIWGPWSRLGV
jgi:secreted PhoX family phosphatase